MYPTKVEILFMSYTGEEIEIPNDHQKMGVFDLSMSLPIFSETPRGDVSVVEVTLRRPTPVSTE